MRNTKIRQLTEAAVMLALAIALSFVKIWRMPLGGSVTLLSMLPLLLLAVKSGTGWGVGTAFIYSLFQLVQSVISGNVFPYCQTLGIVILCVACDYLIPFTALGLCAVGKKRFGKAGVCVGIFASCVVRFICHFITGIFIWGQWAPEGTGKVLYSLLYNGQYMLPEILLTVTAAALLMRTRSFSKLILSI